METTESNNPKDDDQITNDDNSVTNADSNAEEPHKHPEPGEDVAKEIPTVTPDNDEYESEHEQPEDDSSNKDKGPEGENL